MIQIYCDISNGFADQSSGVTAAAYHLRSAVHRAIAHRSAAYDTSDQSTDSAFTGDTCAEQVDIFDRGTFAYIAEQADVASGGDLQSGNRVPVAIKGALKQLRLSVTNGCPGVLRKLNTFIQYNRITTEACTTIYHCRKSLQIIGACNVKLPICPLRQRCIRPADTAQAQRHDQGQNGCQYFFHCNTPYRNLYFRRPHRFNKIVIKTQCNDVVADTLIITSIFRLSIPFCKFSQILSCVHRKIVKYSHFLPFLPRQKQEAARPPASLSRFIFRS